MFKLNHFSSKLFISNSVLLFQRVSIKGPVNYRSIGFTLDYQMTVKNNRAHLKFSKNKDKEEEREIIEKGYKKLKKQSRKC